MAIAPHLENLTPADEMRSLLSDCERALGSLAGSGNNALAIFRALDRVHDLQPQLEARGMDLRPEKTRLATLEAMLQRRSGDVLRSLRPLGGLAKARGAAPIDRTRWWWYLDQQVRRERGRSARRILMAAGGAAVVLLALILLYRHFLAPDPEITLGLELQSRAASLAQSGDYMGALEQLDQAQVMLPADGEIYVWRAVLKTLVGEPGQAAELFDKAAPLFKNTGAFLVARGQVYVQLQELDSAAADAELVLDDDPGSPEGHLLRGSVLEARGSVGEAIGAYDAASRFAEERGMAELSAVARLRMGMLSQLGALPQLAQ